ncbi:hypothetical protein DXC69_23260 [Paenibacillus polymyxa]|uniref:hypothetical protein n=1 Tax=Paenibacillus polymyxa TaxID=1406 RepID=UPI0004DF3F72|nr:hypothetical protein [Paenibacillus polymyxa]MBY7737607.1 hypothetical protein [Paenibacillus polymyxa]RGL30075.1 hypothetical protein DXC69_23260 [Paenibacillus polymyxa]UMR36201.1 hypothetical protein MJ749_01575 [Paenibacillus polymyxa]
MEETIYELMEQAQDMPGGAAKLAILEEAVRLADTSGLKELAYEIRGEIVDCAIFNGYPLKSLIAFSWQLGQFDQNPEEYDPVELLWNYKWILGKVCSFSNISKTQIEDLVEDMRRRYAEYGYNERPYYYYKFRIAMDMGELDEARRYLDMFRVIEPDSMSDCEACEQSQMVRFYYLTGEDEQALAVAKPILSGRMRCAEVPHVTLSQVLLPLYRQGEVDQANEQYRKGYRLVRDDRDFLKTIAEHIEYLTVVNPIEGIGVVERHLHIALDYESGLEQMYFYAAMVGLLQKLDTSSKLRLIRMPASFEWGKQERTLEEIIAYFKPLAESAAAEFDRRNGNTFYTDWIGRIVQPV